MYLKLQNSSCEVKQNIDCVFKKLLKLLLFYLEICVPSNFVAFLLISQICKIVKKFFYFNIFVLSSFVKFCIK